MPPQKFKAKRLAPKKLASEELFEYAVKALTVRGHSRGELRLKLSRRAAVPADIDATIGRLEEIGYLNDTRFAESFASSRVANDGFGRARIVSDLRARRIPAELADKAASAALAGVSETDQVRAFIDRRMPSLARELDDDRRVAAAYRKLRRSGFGTSAVLQVLKTLSSRTDFPDDLPPEENEGEA